MDHTTYLGYLTGRSTITILIIHGGTHPHQSTHLGKHSNGTRGTSTQRTFSCLVQDLAPCLLLSRRVEKGTKIVGKSVKTKEGMGHRFQQRKPGQTHTSKHKHQADTSLKDNNHHLHLSAFHLSQLSGENTYLFRGRRFDMMLFSVFVFMMIQTKVVGRVTSRSVLP